MFVIVCNSLFESGLGINKDFLLIVNVQCEYFTYSLQKEVDLSLPPIVLGIRLVGSYRFQSEHHTGTCTHLLGSQIVATISGSALSQLDWRFACACAKWKRLDVLEVSAR